MTFVCIALVWLTGFSIARFLFPAPPRWSLHSVFLFSLGTGLGIGIASCLYFLSLVLFGPSPLILAGFGAIVAAAAILRGVSAKSHGIVLDWAAGPATPSYLTGLLLLAAAFSITMFVVYSLEKPHGEWDAWSIWNLKARFLFRGGEGWRNALSSQMPNSHPDYPLLLPSIVAMCWTLARAESISAPIAVAFLFTLGACGLLISSIGILRGKTQALVAGIVLLATSSFIQLGAMQYADVPMSFYILATLALLCLQDRFPGDLRFSITAGLTAGFAPWTKNEGWLFLAAVLLARLIAILRFETRTVLGPQFLRFAAAALPSVALTAFFKLRFAPPNDLFASESIRPGCARRGFRALDHHPRRIRQDTLFDRRLPPAHRFDPRTLLVSGTLPRRRTRTNLARHGAPGHRPDARRGIRHLRCISAGYRYAAQCFAGTPLHAIMAGRFAGILSGG